MAPATSGSVSRGPARSVCASRQAQGGSEVALLHFSSGCRTRLFSLCQMRQRRAGARNSFELPELTRLQHPEIQGSHPCASQLQLWPLPTRCFCCRQCYSHCLDRQLQLTFGFVCAVYYAFSTRSQAQDADSFLRVAAGPVLHPTAALAAHVSPCDCISPPIA